MSEIRETRSVKQERTVGYKCDACEKQTTDLAQCSIEWYHFHEGHQGWGNDSGESYQEHDVCSLDCFITQLQDRLPDLLEYAGDGAKIADMPVAFAQKLLDRLLETSKGKEDKDE
jgi:hypothetical protein